MSFIPVSCHTIIISLKFIIIKNSIEVTESLYTYYIYLITLIKYVLCIRSMEMFENNNKEPQAK